MGRAMAKSIFLVDHASLLKTNDSPEQLLLSTFITVKKDEKLKLEGLNKTFVEMSCISSFIQFWSYISLFVLFFLKNSIVKEKFQVKQTTRYSIILASPLLACIRAANQISFLIFFFLFSIFLRFDIYFVIFFL